MTQSLAFFVSHLRRSFTEYCNRKLQEMGLSQGLLYFILYVGKHSGCSPKELSEALHMDMGHTNRCLAKLQQGGFLIQEPNPEDRRAHVLRLTQEGEAAFRASHDLFARWDDEVMGNMEPADRESLLNLLRGLVRRGDGGNENMEG